MPNQQNKFLVAGAGGIVGRCLTNYLENLLLSGRGVVFEASVYHRHKPFHARPAVSRWIRAL